jgi:hypothetical protein
MGIPRKQLAAIMKPRKVAKKVRYASRKLLLEQSEWHKRMLEGAGVFSSGNFPVTANLREHWTEKALRTKNQRLCWYFKAHKWKKAFVMVAPCTFIITRYSPKTCDEDNLRSCFKAVCDGICDRFGVKDDPSSPIKFEYRQEKCPRGCCGARVEIKDVL